MPIIKNPWIYKVLSEYIKNDGSNKFKGIKVAQIIDVPKPYNKATIKSARGSKEVNGKFNEKNSNKNPESKTDDQSNEFLSDKIEKKLDQNNKSVENNEELANSVNSKTEDQQKVENLEENSTYYQLTLSDNEFCIHSTLTPSSTKRYYSGYSEDLKDMNGLFIVILDFSFHFDVKKGKICATINDFDLYHSEGEHESSPDDINKLTEVKAYIKEMTGSFSFEEMVHSVEKEDYSELESFSKLTLSGETTGCEKSDEMKQNQTTSSPHDGKIKESDTETTPKDIGFQGLRKNINEIQQKCHKSEFPVQKPADDGRIISKSLFPNDCAISTSSLTPPESFFEDESFEILKNKSLQPDLGNLNNKPIDSNELNVSILHDDLADATYSSLRFDYKSFSPYDNLDIEEIGEVCGIEEISAIKKRKRGRPRKSQQKENVKNREQIQKKSTNKKANLKSTSEKTLESQESLVERGHKERTTASEVKCKDSPKSELAVNCEEKSAIPELEQKSADKTVGVNSEQPQIEPSVDPKTENLSNSNLLISEDGVSDKIKQLNLTETQQINEKAVEGADTTEIFTRQEPSKYSIFKPNLYYDNVLTSDSHEPGMSSDESVNKSTCKMREFEKHQTEDTACQTQKSNVTDVENLNKKVSKNDLSDDKTTDLNSEQFNSAKIPSEDLPQSEEEIIVDSNTQDIGRCNLNESNDKTFDNPTVKIDETVHTNDKTSKETENFNTLDLEKTTEISEINAQNENNDNLSKLSQSTDNPVDINKNTDKLSKSNQDIDSTTKDKDLQTNMSDSESQALNATEKEKNTSQQNSIADSSAETSDNKLETHAISATDTESPPIPPEIDLKPEISNTLSEKKLYNESMAEKTGMRRIKKETNPKSKNTKSKNKNDKLSDEKDKLSDLRTLNDKLNDKRNSETENADEENKSDKMYVRRSKNDKLSQSSENEDPIQNASKTNNQNEEFSDNSSEKIQHNTANNLSNFDNTKTPSRSVMLGDGFEYIIEESSIDSPETCPSESPDTCQSESNEENAQNEKPEAQILNQENLPDENNKNEYLDYQNTQNDSIDYNQENFSNSIDFNNSMNQDYLNSSLNIIPKNYDNLEEIRNEKMRLFNSYAHLISLTSRKQTSLSELVIVNSKEKDGEEFKLYNKVIERIIKEIKKIEMRKFEITAEYTNLVRNSPPEEENENEEKTLEVLRREKETEFAFYKDQIMAKLNECFKERLSFDGEFNAAFEAEKADEKARKNKQRKNKGKSFVQMIQEKEQANRDEKSNLEMAICELIENDKEVQLENEYFDSHLNNLNEIDKKLDRKPDYDGKSTDKSEGKEDPVIGSCGFQHFSGFDEPENIRSLLSQKPKICSYDLDKPSDENDKFERYTERDQYTPENDESTDDKLILTNEEFPRLSLKNSNRTDSDEERKFLGKESPKTGENHNQHDLAQLKRVKSENKLSEEKISENEKSGSKNENAENHQTSFTENEQLSGSFSDFAFNGQYVTDLTGKTTEVRLSREFDGSNAKKCAKEKKDFENDVRKLKNGLIKEEIRKRKAAEIEEKAKTEPQTIANQVQKNSPSPNKRKRLEIVIKVKRPKISYTISTVNNTKDPSQASTLYEMIIDNIGMDEVHNVNVLERKDYFEIRRIKTKVKNKNRTEEVVFRFKDFKKGDW